MYVLEIYLINAREIKIIFNCKGRVLMLLVTDSPDLGFENFHVCSII